MKRRAYIIGVLAVGLAAATVHHSPLYGRLSSSAQQFCEQFRDLQGAGNSLSPVERFVFSLVLTNTKTPHPEDRSTAPGGRT